MQNALSENTLRFCLICFVASGCAADPGSSSSIENHDGKIAVAASPVIDSEVQDSLNRHGFAAVHVRVFPETLLGKRDVYTWDELSAALNELFTGNEWEQIGMVQNQPEFLGYLSSEGMRILKEKGVAEFIARGDRIDGVLN
jgi:hypothetical protein